MRVPLIIFLLLSSFFVQAQSFQDKYQLIVAKTAVANRIDGVLDEAVWQRAVEVGDFWEKFPSDKNKAKLNTTVKAAYDGRFLYFAITCYDTTNKFVAPSLKRDGSIRESDGVAIILDPLNKKTNGFSFATTPFNVQSEYQFGAGASGNGGGPNLAWDNKWYSAVKRSNESYIMEIAIPFKTLRYDPGIKKWGVNFIRSDQKNFKFYTWTNVPVQFPGFDLGYLGSMTFEEEIPEAKKNFALIPFITGGATNNKEAGTTKGTLGIGLDAKVSLTPSVNMDLTLFPDFSQVEVDKQVTNLTRFSIFFPERRTFFLENDDIFSDYGNPPIKPFFSRRIGLDANSNPIPIVFGAKVSGSIGERLRVGAFNMSTAKKGDFAAQNYTAVSVIQQFGKRSSVKAYFLNRSANLIETDSSYNPLNKYGRNAGIEISLSDNSGKLNAWAGYHLSQKSGIINNNFFYQFGGGYFGSKFSGIIDVAEVKDNYYTDMGFVNRIETLSTLKDTYASGDTTYRTGFKQLFTDYNYFIRPKGGKVATYIFSFNNFLNLYQDNKLSENSQSFGFDINFKNAARFETSIDRSHEFLKYYFPLPELKPLTPGNYTYTNATIGYSTDGRKNVTWLGKIKAGQFYNGVLKQYSTQFSVRKQPWWTIALLAEYNIINFPTEYGQTKLLLFSPKTEINFNNKTFWTTFFQFNTQANNMNINSRLQYRYSPMSDLFLVYTDNYFTDPLFKNKNRGIIFKFNYWFS